MGGLESLAAETAVQFLPALAFLLVLGARGDSTFTHHGPGHAALLALSGLVTAVPLVCFGDVARTGCRCPRSACSSTWHRSSSSSSGVLHFHETMPAEQWVGFLLVWSALVLLTWDALRTARRARAELARAEAARADGGPADPVDPAAAAEVA